MDHAAAAAVLAAAAAPPPRPPRRQARTTRQTQSTSSGLTAPSARPGSAAEPARYAPAAPSLPPWLLKQRDALFREATSFAEESQQSQDTKPPDGASHSKLGNLDFAETGHDATDMESPEPTPRGSRNAGPTPPKRDYWGEKWEKEQSSVERLALRVARDIGNQLRTAESTSLSNSDTSSPPKTRADESVQLQQAVREREIANECVKNLTTEVVRLAGELRAQTILPVSSDLTRQGGAPLSPRRKAVYSKQLQQALRRRKHIQMWSALRSWSDTIRRGRRSHGMSDNPGRHIPFRSSRAVLQAWGNRAKQRGRLECAMGTATGKATASAFDVWRLQSHARAIEEQSSHRIMCGKRGERIQQGSHRLRSHTTGQSEHKGESVQLLSSRGHGSDMQHYLQFVAIRQMHARWTHRCIQANFRKMQEKCRNMRRLGRVLKRSFLTISARRISMMLKHGLEGFQILRIRSLRKVRAAAAGHARNLNALKLIFVTWRASLHVKHVGDSQDATGELASSVQRLKKTLGSLNHDRSSLANRLALLLDDSAEGGKVSSRRLNNTKVSSPVITRGEWPALLERGDVSRSIDQTQRDLDADDTIRQADEQKRIEHVYETLESTLQVQASDIQKLEWSCVKSAAIEKTIREELTDALRSVHDGKTAVEMRRKTITAAVEARQARQRDTWLAFDDLETLLQLAEVKHESGTFVDTILLTPGQPQLHGDTSLVTPYGGVMAGLGEQQAKQREVEMLLHEWQRMADIFNETHNASSIAEFPGISLQLLREHVQDLRAATLSISRKDPSTTEKSLRRLQVNAKLLHIETAQQGRGLLPQATGIPEPASEEGRSAGANPNLQPYVASPRSPDSSGKRVNLNSMRGLAHGSTLGAEYWI